MSPNTLPTALTIEACFPRGGDITGSELKNRWIYQRRKYHHQTSLILVSIFHGTKLMQAIMGRERGEKLAEGIEMNDTYLSGDIPVSTAEVRLIKLLLWLLLR